MKGNPTHLRIDNNLYELNTDFRAWVDMERLIRDMRVSPDARTERMLALIFVEPPPLYKPEAIKGIMQQVMLFYHCGKVPEQTGGKNTDIVYAYDVDHQRIKAEYIRYFSYDPWKLPYLHWWDYRACFDYILGDTFSNMAQLRTLDLSQYKGSNRAKMAQVKERYRIKAPIDTQQEQEIKAREEAYKSGNLAEYLASLNKRKE